ncbi:hypothetical protein NQ176_g273 [Zarea fungicola]|uniref:Uncharacterized protein n=1 Tax=Zarea fungicola TaxID=93591 RepID=A0ACC1NY62_9HYPO|nr:hypothetical protein NQ176_g273 [Lecanicillium fungicola]
MTREAAQKWADSHGMQTLTTAMGEYMDPESEHCPQKRKSRAEWIKYVHGASALFALQISEGEVVTVLSNPPPQRFHPDGNTSFQCIEAPIITGELGNRAVNRIEIVHPLVAAASEFTYQIWPKDCVNNWTEKYSESPLEVNWRKVKKRKSLHSNDPKTANKVRFYEERDIVCTFTSPDPGVTTVIEKQPLPCTGHGAVCIAKDRKAKRKEELAALDAAFCAGMKAFSRAKKAERISLNQRQISALRNNREKPARNAVIRKYDELRQELQSRHRRQLKELEEMLRASRRALKDWYKAAPKLEQGS